MTADTPTPDVLERLRHQADTHLWSVGEATAREAADELVRLRAENDKLRAALGWIAEQPGNLSANSLVVVARDALDMNGDGWSDE